MGITGRRSTRNTWALPPQPAQFAPLACTIMCVAVNCAGCRTNRSPPCPSLPHKHVTRVWDSNWPVSYCLWGAEHCALNLPTLWYQWINTHHRLPVSHLGWHRSHDAGNLGSCARWRAPPVGWVWTWRSPLTPPKIHQHQPPLIRLLCQCNKDTYSWRRTTDWGPAKHIHGGKKRCC